MRKKRKTAPPKENEYPSKFGSHLVMVEEELDKEMVICKDERGLYLTKRFRLDSGMADPARWGETKYREQKLKDHKDLEILRNRYNR